MAARKAVILISPTLGLKTGSRAHPYSVHIQCHLCFIVVSFLEFGNSNKYPWWSTKRHLGEANRFENSYENTTEKVSNKSG